MNWFDTAGLANIAKSALKGAQRTIDKALDIKGELDIVPTNTPVDTNPEDFFGNWDNTYSEHCKAEKQNTSESKLTENTMKDSIWGSFTGSFFDTNEGNLNKRPVDNLEDVLDSRVEHFSRSKLVVQHGDTTSSSASAVKTDKESMAITEMESCDQNKEELTDEIYDAKRTVSEKCDSGTSPSSIEIIDSDGSACRSSQQTEEFVSPLDSPWSDNKSSSIEKISETVEVIPDDLAENIMAEETVPYKSISEGASTIITDPAVNLQLNPQKMLKYTFSNMDTTMETSTDSLLSLNRNSIFPDAITKAPSRINMHLPLTQVNQIFNSQHHGDKEDISSILENTNIIDIPQDNIASSSLDPQLNRSSDEGLQIDKSFLGNSNILESSSDTSSTTETSSHSAYLKNMLADAMAEKSVDSKILGTSVILSNSGDGIDNILISELDVHPRENSPISSESRSDLVKIGSDYNSGHTSGDEIETTTSSDIEIISSPNGDSSSTQSRQSPAKQTCIKTKSEESSINTLLCKITVEKTKGHARELSEASSISDDSHSSEIDKLLKKMSEMTEILESRESKLVEINRRNLELQGLNNDLKMQLNCIITKQLESADLSQITEEYTQRLSALEKKFQQAIREKDSLRKQLEHEKQEVVTRITKEELEGCLLEKNEIINELREEGEKLSRQQLQHSNIIKKLRSKERENENLIKHLKETIEELSVEAERLKKSLTAKEEVERSQIEAVHLLSNKNKKLDIEIVNLKSQLEDLMQKYESARNSLDAAKKELIDKNKTSSELLVREQMVEVLENQKRIADSQNEEICSQLENLRYKLQQSGEEYIKNEQKLRQENNELLTRLEEAETTNEELSQSVLEMSKPLIRQLESLQATYNIKVASFEKIEEELNRKIRELTAKVQTSNNAERLAKEEYMVIKSKLQEVESQLSTANNKLHLLQMQLEQQKAEKQSSDQELIRKNNELIDTNKQNKELMMKKDDTISKLQEELLTLKSSNVETQQQNRIKEKNESPNSTNLDLTSARSDSNSPTLSLGKISACESMESSFWLQDEQFDLGQIPRYTNVFEMQILQTNLKQREGEVQQLQWELNRREQEKALISSEVSTLLMRIEDLESKANGYDVIQNQFSELQQKYDTLCQLYGEKVEENEELKLDLQDVKDMYKSQVNELLKQQKQNAK